MSLILFLLCWERRKLYAWRFQCKKCSVAIQCQRAVVGVEQSVSSVRVYGRPGDGCFDGRNHLYFSDGTQWIPLDNCVCEDENDALRSEIDALKSQMADVLAQLGAS